ncbi:MAG: gamma-glutamyl-gamma-aminobutyrate hydrolase family protein [Bacteriovoracia bacterium]
MISIFLIFVALLAPAQIPQARAEDPITFYRWRPTAESPPLLLPVTAGESPAEAARRYVAAIEDRIELKPLLLRALDDPKQWTEKMPPGELTRLPPPERKPRGRSRIVLLANEFDDTLPNSTRVNNLAKQLEAAGAEVLTLPLGTDLLFSDLAYAKYRDDFDRQLSEQVDALFAMGGDDIAPPLYGEPKMYANRKELNILRDDLELRVLRAYRDRGEGTVLGVCRGMQLCGVLHGHTLTQDIPIETGLPKNLHQNPHPVDLIGRPDGKPSLLSQASGNTGGQPLVWVSRHHEAVESRPGSDLIETGRHGKIIEAMESRDGMFFLLQFHPEESHAKVDPDQARRMMEFMVGHVAHRRDLRGLPCVPRQLRQALGAP